MAADTVLWGALDDELRSMVDQFAVLMKSCKIHDEDAEHVLSKDKKQFGGLLEVQAEKLVQSGHVCLNIVSQLKEGAVLNDFGSLMDSVRIVRAELQKEEDESSRAIMSIKREAHELLYKLESSYYSSKHKGKPLTADGPSQNLLDLCNLALETVPER